MEWLAAMAAGAFFLKIPGARGPRFFAKNRGVTNTSELLHIFKWKTGQKCDVLVGGHFFL